MRLCSGAFGGIAGGLAGPIVDLSNSLSTGPLGGLVSGAKELIGKVPVRVVLDLELQDGIQ